MVIKVKLPLLLVTLIMEVQFKLYLALESVLAKNPGVETALSLPGYEQENVCLFVKWTARLLMRGRDEVWDIFYKEIPHPTSAESCKKKP